MGWLTMSLRTLASLAVAVLLGLIAVMLIRTVMAQRAPQTAAAVATTPVVVAALPIDRGAMLKPAMLKVVNFPNEAIPVGSFKTVAEIAGPNGRVAMRS